MSGLEGPEVRHAQQRRDRTHRQTLKNDPSNGPTEQPEFTETVLNLVVAVFFYSILAYAFMFISSLPPKYEWLLVFVGATVVLFL